MESARLDLLGDDLTLHYMVSDTGAVLVRTNLGKDDDVLTAELLLELLDETLLLDQLLVVRVLGEWHEDGDGGLAVTERELLHSTHVSTSRRRQIWCY